MITEFIDWFFDKFRDGDVIAFGNIRQFGNVADSTVNFISLTYRPIRSDLYVGNSFN